jgi:hypothetical protein
MKLVFNTSSCREGRDSVAVEVDATRAAPWDHDTAGMSIVERTFQNKLP